MKGQALIEFIAAFFLFMIATVTVFQSVSDQTPQFADQINEKSVYTEAKYVSDNLLSTEGHHTYGNGGNNWEKNQSTVKSIQSIGITSDYFEIDPEKLEMMESRNSSKLNYSIFRNTMDLENQYNIRFTATPIVHTDNSFEKGETPSSPPITEPNHPLYDGAEPTVKYGKIKFNNENLYFLTTSHLSNYNTTYVSDDWDFTASNPVGTQESISIMGMEIFVEEIQSLGESPGETVVLSSSLKTFGAQVPTDAQQIKINRYAVFRDGYGGKFPARIEVLGW